MGLLTHSRPDVLTHRQSGWGLALAVSLSCLHPVIAQAADPGLNLRDLTFEQLAEISVVTVSKKEEPLFRAPAAVAALTTEDLRRSGAMTLTEALRWVPGLDVAQASNPSWAVSARGFHAVAANKMLVMIDGRSAYQPLTGQVIYTTIDPVPEEIERVEVVRGPGASVWGANFSREWDVALAGQNLLHGQHAEFRTTLPSVPPHEVRRGVYCKVAKRY